MSESYDNGMASATGIAAADPPGTLDTAKQEAADLKDTAAEQAKSVAGTVQDEAGAVAEEAKSQAKQLYVQTRQELSDQAHTQQQRIAAGLRSVSDDLGSMAAKSDSGGLAADVVREVSGRMAGAASWLGDRDPATLLTEVKRYARRHPGTFILAAALTGVVVGRLTRALASNASDESSAPSGPTTVRRPQPVVATSPAYDALPTDGEFADTPIYAQSSAGMTDATVSEDGDARTDTL